MDELTAATAHAFVDLIGQNERASSACADGWKICERKATLGLISESGTHYGINGVQG